MKVILTGAESHIINKVRDTFLAQGYIVQLFPMLGEEWDEKIIEKGDVVVHIAGITPKKEIETDLFYVVNHLKTKRLVSICEEKEVSHLIYISTMAVYGEQLKKIRDNPIGLDTPCDNPAPYGESKLLAEKEVKKFSEAIKWTILRVPSLYDEVRQEYFYPFYNFAARLPFIPSFSFNTKRSILCIDNLCRILCDVTANKNEVFTNRILLPSDDCEYDVNYFFDKVCKDHGIKKHSIKISQRMAIFLTKCFPFFLSYTFNAHYSDTDVYKYAGKTVNDFKISSETSYKNQA